MKALRRSLLAVVAACGLAPPGCAGRGDGGCTIEQNENADCGRGVSFVFGECPDGDPIDCVGTRDDGRIDISAGEAWPNRAPEPPPLSAEQIAEGCAAFAACTDTAPRIRGFSLINLSGDEATMKSSLLAACLEGGFGGYSDEHRVIPLDYYDERWSFALREVLAANGDCDTIRAILTPSTTPIRCEEDGCWSSTEASSVTCASGVAVFADGARRDCSRSYTKCSPSSPTGCTDRPLMGCHTDALDRCDGNIKLGCDRCGFVTFRDCAYNGGRCVEDADGAHCEPASATDCTVASPCNESTLSVCVSGKPVAVDCAALGAECHTTTFTLTLSGADAGLSASESDAGGVTCGPTLFGDTAGGDESQCTYSYCVAPGQ